MITVCCTIVTCFTPNVAELIGHKKTVIYVVDRHIKSQTLDGGVAGGGRGVGGGQAFCFVLGGVFFSLPPTPNFFVSENVIFKESNTVL